MSERATCWSITINNPTEEDLKPRLPYGWKLEGQIERGEEGTQHYQAMLTTPQTRFNAIKRHLPRAHIEPARDKAALKAYVHKTESRVREVTQLVGLTAFALQDKVLEQWNDDDFKDFRNLMSTYDNKAYLMYADCIVRKLIRDGNAGGIEFVAINPMWRTSWAKFGDAMLIRFRNKKMSAMSIDG